PRGVVVGAVRPEGDGDAAEHETCGDHPEDALEGIRLDECRCARLVVIVGPGRHGGGPFDAGLVGQACGRHDRFPARGWSSYRVPARVVTRLERRVETRVELLSHAPALRR